MTLISYISIPIVEPDGSITKIKVDLFTNKIIKNDDLEEMQNLNISSSKKSTSMFSSFFHK